MVLLPRTPSRNCLKRGSETLARYPTEHEKSISDRPLRRRVVLPRASSARLQSLRAPQATHLARDPRRHLLRRSRRLRLEAVASRLPTLEDRLPLLPLLAFGRDVGEDAHCPAPTGAGPPREEPPAQRRDSG